MTGLHWEDDGSQESLLTRRSAQICLSDKEIEDFVFGRLSGVTREVIEEHLLACATCLARVEAEEEYTAAFRTAATRLESEDLNRAYHAPAQAGTNPARHWAWILAGVATVLGGVYVANRPPALNEAQVALRVERGAEGSSPAAQAGQPLRLVPDITGLRELPVYTLSVVDSTGRPIHSSDLSPESGRVEAILPKGLPSGTYWVRISTPGPHGELLREYALPIR